MGDWVVEAHKKRGHKDWVVDELVVVHTVGEDCKEEVTGHMGDWVVEAHKKKGHKEDWVVDELVVVHNVGEDCKEVTGHIGDWVVEAHKKKGHKKDWVVNELVVVHTVGEDCKEEVGELVIVHTEGDYHKKDLQGAFEVHTDDKQERLWLAHKDYRLEDHKDCKQGGQTVEQPGVKFRKATRELEILSSFVGCPAFETGPSQFRTEHRTFVER